MKEKKSPKSQIKESVWLRQNDSTAIGKEVISPLTKPGSSHKTSKPPLKIKVSNPSIINKINASKRIFGMGNQQTSTSASDQKAVGLNRVNSIRKANGAIGIMGGFGALGQSAASLNGGIASRTTSRGGQMFDKRDSSPGGNMFYPGKIQTEETQGDESGPFKKLQIT